MDSYKLCLYKLCLDKLCLHKLCDKLYLYKLRPHKLRDKLCLYKLRPHKLRDSLYSILHRQPQAIKRLKFFRPPYLKPQLQLLPLNLSKFLTQKKSTNGLYKRLSTNYAL